MKYYYRLWSDAINWARSSIRTIGVWKMLTLGLITLAMSFNIGILCLAIEQVAGNKILIFHLKVQVTKSQSINGFLGATLLFYLPPLLINYFLIFYQEKWKEIRKTYPHKNGKMYKRYVMISVVLPIWVLIIIGLIYKAVY